MSETIIAAAVLNGLAVHSVPPPGRHGDVLRRMYEDGTPLDHAAHEQGFVTSKGRFVSREDAMLIATAAGQCKPRRPGQYNGPRLFSEDLW